MRCLNHLRKDFVQKEVNLGVVIPFGDKPKYLAKSEVVPVVAAPRDDCSTRDSDSDGVNDCLDKCPGVAEDTGLINEIGRWVFHQAAEQVSAWRLNHHTQFQISINKSPAQFHSNSDKLVDWFEHIQFLGLPGASIAVEITEGLLLDSSTIVSEKLLALKKAGIQTSLNDFGTGYSSLAYLKKHQIDYLKIDRGFVSNLTTNSTEMALCVAIISMAHILGMKVIAECVETTEQRDLLLKAGCDYGQGYLFSKPVTAEEFEVLLMATQVKGSLRFRFC